MKELDGRIEQGKNELNRIRQDREKARTELNSVQRTIATAKENFHTQKAELQSQQEKYLRENKLSWKKIKLVVSLLNSELSATGLKEEQIERLREQISATGSLIIVMTQLKQKKNSLQSEIDDLSDYVQHYTREIEQLAHTREQLEISIHHKKDERGKLETEIESKGTELAEVKREITEKTESLYISHLVIDFLLNPVGITNYDLDRLVEMMIALRQKRLSIEPKQVLDASGKVVCRCQVPRISTDLKAHDIDVNHARETFALLISPLVRDKMVSRFEYDLAEMKHETLGKVAVAKATLDATIQERNRHLI
jgi:predicted  nucleic acid-binding Zn-ribbon protein